MSVLLLTDKFSWWSLQLHAIFPSRSARICSQLFLAVSSTEDNTVPGRLWKCKQGHVWNLLRVWKSGLAPIIENDTTDSLMSIKDRESMFFKSDSLLFSTLKPLDKNIGLLYGLKYMKKMIHLLFLYDGIAKSQPLLCKHKITNAYKYVLNSWPR